MKKNFKAISSTMIGPLDCLDCLPHSSFFNFFPTSHLPTTRIFCYFVNVAECVSVITPELCVIFLSDLMNLNLLNFGTLVPAAPCGVLCNKEIKFTEGF